MLDLYSDDIEDQRIHSDEAILREVRVLVTSGQREGSTLDYKKEISPKDNWPETAAAFANTFGGLIVFGVEGKLDQPRTLTGFNSNEGETRTRITSTLISRIQPRPNFHVRVVSLDSNSNREIAVLRVQEGVRPPYMYSKEDQHRIYVRVGAQKAEADYLQLSALLEKRNATRPTEFVSIEHLVGPATRLNVHRPVDSNIASPDWYRFLLIPAESSVTRRINREVESEFQQCLEQIYPVSDSLSQTAMRTESATFYRRGTGNGNEQRFAVTREGLLGFLTHACVEDNSRAHFVTADFCRDLAEFLCVASLFYNKARYYGELSLQIGLVIPNQGDQTALVRGQIFQPPIEHIFANGTFTLPVVLNPTNQQRLQEYLTNAANDLARMGGSVLNGTFADTVRCHIANALERLQRL